MIGPGLSIVFAITSKILRIPMEDIESKNSLDSQLQIQPICSIRILSTLEVVAKNVFFFQKSQNAQP